jgi:hypothetical protein
MEWSTRNLHRRDVIAALFGGVVIQITASQRHGAELRAQGFDHVADIDEFVVPDIQSGKP